jgi:hypothetical protein
MFEFLRAIPCVGEREPDNRIDVSKNQCKAGVKPFVEINTFSDVLNFAKVIASESVMLSTTVNEQFITVLEYSAHTVTQDDKYRYITFNRSKSIICGCGFPFIYNSIYILTAVLNTVKLILTTKPASTYDLFY